jgi:hypothetical protein
MLANFLGVLKNARPPPLKLGTEASGLLGVQPPAHPSALPQMLAFLLRTALSRPLALPIKALGSGFFSVSNLSFPGSRQEKWLGDKEGLWPGEQQATSKLKASWDREVQQALRQDPPVSLSVYPPIPPFPCLFVCLPVQPVMHPFILA